MFEFTVRGGKENTPHLVQMKFREMYLEIKTKDNQKNLFKDDEGIVDGFNFNLIPSADPKSQLSILGFDSKIFQETLQEIPFGNMKKFKIKKYLDALSLKYKQDINEIFPKSRDRTRTKPKKKKTFEELLLDEEVEDDTPIKRSNIARIIPISILPILFDLFFFNIFCFRLVEIPKLFLTTYMKFEYHTFEWIDIDKRYIDQIRLMFHNSQTLFAYAYAKAYLHEKSLKKNQKKRKGDYNDQQITKKRKRDDNDDNQPIKKKRKLNDKVQQIKNKRKRDDNDEVQQIKKKRKGVLQK
jgi:hypothetical protein